MLHVSSRRERSQQAMARTCQNRRGFECQNNCGGFSVVPVRVKPSKSPFVVVGLLVSPPVSSASPRHSVLVTSVTRRV